MEMISVSGRTERIGTVLERKLDLKNDILVIEMWRSSRRPVTVLHSCRTLSWQWQSCSSQLIDANLVHLDLNPRTRVQIKEVLDVARYFGV